MNTSKKKNILVFLLKKCNQLKIRKVIKKFVDWCDDIYLFSYVYNFCMENKTANVLLVVKIEVKYVDK